MENEAYQTEVKQAYTNDFRGQDVREEIRRLIATIMDECEDRIL